MLSLSTNFYKYEGAGNDFILVEHSLFEELPSENVARICDRHLGVGGDGLLLYERLGDKCWRMVIYNADGSRASMCGNALRCLSAHLWATGRELAAHTIISDVHKHRIELADSPNDPTPSIFWVKTGIGAEHQVELDLDQKLVDLELSRPWLDPAAVRHIDWLDTGVPHLLFVSEKPSIDLKALGHFWRHHPHFAPAGVNVSVVIWNQAKDRLESKERAAELCHSHKKGPVAFIEMSTYERGVEEVTLACGTGAAAAALSYFARHNDQGCLVQFDRQLPFYLETDWSLDSRKLFQTPLTAQQGSGLIPRPILANISLTGPARFVFEGRLADRAWLDQSESSKK